MAPSHLDCVYSGGDSLMSGLSVASGAAVGSPQIEGGMEGGWKALGQSARLGALIPHVDSVQGVAGIRMEGWTIASGTADRGGGGDRGEQGGSRSRARVRHQTVALLSTLIAAAWTQSGKHATCLDDNNVHTTHPRPPTSSTHSSSPFCLRCSCFMQLPLSLPTTDLLHALTHSKHPYQSHLLRPHHGRLHLFPSSTKPSRCHRSPPETIRPLLRPDLLRTHRAEGKTSPLPPSIS